MALSPGSTFGPYEVVELIGIGGMGEVYRARDTVLHRDVALKVLPDTGKLDADALQRFEREARLLASLNHPNIATLHGLETTAGARALVMELVDGETLDHQLAVASRNARGGLPLKEALRIAVQIADALDAAHERGIVHRDLKPSNIKIRSDGTVKILDFGIAKVFQPDDWGKRGAAVATITHMAGAVVGTPAYMSPEQARGSAVDKRTDVWAFGCVLYEMLTGERAFTGEQASDVIARIIEREPNLGALPATVPQGVRRILRRCLAKDPRERLRDIGDARLELAEAQASPDDVDGERHAVQRSPVLARAAFVALGAACVLLAAALISNMLLRSDSRVVTRFPVVIASGQVIQVNAYQSIALSPDATHLAYITTERIYLRGMQDSGPEPVAGTEGQDAQAVLFSPDGQWLAFYSPRYRELRRVPLGGGTPVRVASAAGYLGGSWAEDGSIVFAQEGGIFSVPGTGGTPSLLLAVDRERGELGLNPVMLPGGRNVMFTLMAAADPQQATTRSIVVQSLGSEDRRVVIQNGADARYLETGHLVYADGSTLLVVPFDVDSLSVTGTPIPGATQVANQPVNRIADFAVSRSGSLVYRTGAWRIRTLAWVDREGRQEAVGAPARAYDYARLSPDGTKIAVSLRDEGEDIFVFDIASKAFTRITFDPGTDYLPVWTDDARRVVFASIAQSGSRIIARKAVDGTGAIERLFDAGADVANPVALLPSGTELVFRQITPEGRNNLWLLPLDGSGVANPLLATEHDEFNGEVSPDGRWLAYQSEESGSFEIYLRPFPDVDGGKWQVSNGGGIQPLWSPDGTELFYLASGRLMGLSIGGGAAPAIGAPRVILPELTYTPYERSGRTYDISPDGRRFLILHTPTTVSDDPFDGLNRFEVVLNWSEELAPQ